MSDLTANPKSLTSYQNIFVCIFMHGYINPSAKTLISLTLKGGFNIEDNRNQRANGGHQKKL